MPGPIVHMVDLEPTIPSITTSSTPLGYTSISSGLTFAYATTHISTTSTSTTSISGTGPLGGIGGGGGTGPLGGTAIGGCTYSAPAPPPPYNPILNTILQNMGQLQLQLTNLASISGHSSMSTYCRNNPLNITILNTILPPIDESLKFDRVNGDGDPNVNIDYFMTMCSDYHTLEFVLVKLFSWSLKGTILEWYSSLPDHSIHTFDQLVDLFLKWF